MLKLQYFGPLLQTADSLEKTLMLGKIEGRWERSRAGGEGDDRGLDGITDSMHMSLSKLQKIVKNWEAWRKAVPAVPKRWTQLSN